MRRTILVSLGLLAGCGDTMTEAERKAREDADVAYVAGLERQNPPPEPIEPQAIGYPDIEQFGLTGAQCAFAPGTSLGAVAIAMDDTAWLKIGGQMTRLAADTGGGKLPMGAWQHYDGKAYSLTLTIDQSHAGPSGVETVNYPGKLTVRDAYDQMVYAAEGTVQCAG